MQEFLGRAFSMGEMRALTPKDVKPVYKKLYSDNVRFDDLPSALDWAVLDWAVNSGTGKVAKALQKILGAKQDGAIGPKTLQVVANYKNKKLLENRTIDVKSFTKASCVSKTFGKGWTHRNDETRGQAKSDLISMVGLGCHLILMAINQGKYQCTPVLIKSTPRTLTQR